MPLTSGHTNASDVNESDRERHQSDGLRTGHLQPGAAVRRLRGEHHHSALHVSGQLLLHRAGGWTLAIDPSTGGAFKTSFFGSNHTFVDIGGQVVSGEALSGTGTPSMVTYNGQSYLVTQNVSGTGTVVEANPPAGTKGSRLT